MLITIGFGLLLVIGIVVFYGFYDYYYDNDFVGFIGIMFAIVGLIGLVTSGLVALMVKVNLDLDYEKMLNERNLIEYRLEQIEESGESGSYAEIQLYHDIIEYNKVVLTQKKWANNIWTNWFYNRKVAELELITVEVK